LQLSLERYIFALLYKKSDLLYLQKHKFWLDNSDKFTWRSGRVAESTGLLNRRASWHLFWILRNRKLYQILFGKSFDQRLLENVRGVAQSG